MNDKQDTNKKQEYQPGDSRLNRMAKDAGGGRNNV